MILALLFPPKREPISDQRLQRYVLASRRHDTRYARHIGRRAHQQENADPIAAPSRNTHTAGNFFALRGPIIEMLVTSEP